MANAPWTIQPPLPEVSDLLEKAAQDLHLEGEMKERLIEMLQHNKDVCTTKVGRTGLLKHQILLNEDIPIKQKPYRLSPVPTIQEILESLAGATVFSALDLNSG